LPKHLLLNAQPLSEMGLAHAVTSDQGSDNSRLGIILNQDQDGDYSCIGRKNSRDSTGAGMMDAKRR
jgi:hypothetical protein